MDLYCAPYTSFVPLGLPYEEQYSSELDEI